MSLVQLLLACESHLRDTLHLPTREVSAHEDGQPHPDMGRRFIAIHGKTWQSAGPSEGYIDETYTVGITITYRLPQIPPDRQFEYVWAKAVKGMEALMRDITAAIHQSYTLLGVANTKAATAEGKLVTDPTFYKFIEPLEWSGGDATPRTETGDWVFSDNPEEANKEAAMVAELEFSGCRRMLYNRVFT